MVTLIFMNMSIARKYNLFLLFLYYNIFLSLDKPNAVFGMPCWKGGHESTGGDHSGHLTGEKMFTPYPCGGCTMLCGNGMYQQSPDDNNCTSGPVICKYAFDEIATQSITCGQFGNITHFVGSNPFMAEGIDVVLVLDISSSSTFYQSGHLLCQNLTSYSHLYASTIMDLKLQQTDIQRITQIPSLASSVVFISSFINDGRLQRNPRSIPMDSEAGAIIAKSQMDYVTNTNLSELVNWASPEKYYSDPTGILCDITLLESTVILISGYGALFNTLDQSTKSYLQLSHKQNKSVIYKYHQNFKNNHYVYHKATYQENYQLRYKTDADVPEVVFAIPIRVLKGTLKIRCSTTRMSPNSTTAATTTTPNDALSSDSEGPQLTLILIVVTLVLLITVVVLVAVLVCMRRRINKKAHKTSEGEPNSGVNVNSSKTENEYATFDDPGAADEYCELDDVQSIAKTKDAATKNLCENSNGTVLMEKDRNPEISKDNAYSLETAVSNESANSCTLQDENKSKLETTKAEYKIDNAYCLENDISDRKSIVEMVSNEVYNSNDASSGSVLETVGSGEHASEHESATTEEKRKSITQMINNDVYKGDETIINGSVVHDNNEINGRKNHAADDQVHTEDRDGQETVVDVVQFTDDGTPTEQNNDERNIEESPRILEGSDCDRNSPVCMIDNEVYND